MVQILFTREGKHICVPEGTTVLEAEILAGLSPDAPCGGAGTCGKCLVSINGQTVKACQTRADGDLEVDTLVHTEGHVILTEGMTRPVAFHPSLAEHRVRLTKPLPGEKRSEWERLVEALEADGGPKADQVQADPRLASELYSLRCQREEWFVIHTDREILELSPRERQICFAAFDIGTTTVAGYLLDARDGKTLAVTSAVNPQAQYGADVIMRSNYALEHGLEPLSACIREKLSEMLQTLAKEAGLETSDVFQVSIVGNTCMHHLFLGVSPASLVHAPYTPALSRGMTLAASDYGLGIHPRGRILMLPNIAGYVGADTCGCLMAVRPDLREETTLLLDIGTNGEMVLGSRRGLAACSTAAGPAFEGAKIECGMRGARGAVDHVSYEEGSWSYTTIGGAPAVGLCGSGLIDLVACLIRAGLIDENGRLESGQENPHVFVLVPPERSGSERGVYLTQKDIGEVQLAKAAIAAGIELLMRRLQVSEDDISCVFIAGAFGNYMDAASAGEIGILPKSLSRRVQAVGNAAGEGAKIALLSQEERRAAETLVRDIDFVELAASPEFQDCFVDALGF